MRTEFWNIPAPDLPKTPEALTVGGQAAFGLRDVPYRPLPGRFADGVPGTD